MSDVDILYEKQKSNQNQIKKMSSKCSEFRLTRSHDIFFMSIVIQHQNFEICGFFGNFFIPDLVIFFIFNIILSKMFSDRAE